MNQNKSSLLFILCALSALATTNACVPQDVASPVTVSVTATAAPVTYASFNGATKAETTGASRVKISWDPAGDAKVVAYNIYDVTSLFFPTFLKTVSAPLTSVTITNLNPGTYYKFRVRAADVKNVEDVNTTDLPAIPYGGASTAQVIDNTSATINYADGSNADEINVHCMVAPSTAYTLSFAAVPGTSPTHLVITGLTAGSTYTCRTALTISGFEDNNTTTTAAFTPIGEADHYLFSTQPGNNSPGTSVDATTLSPQPVLTIQDISGNTVTAGPDATAIITLTNTADGTTLGACPACKGIVTWGRAAVTGCAACPAINFTSVGDKTITATKSDTSLSTHGTGVLTPAVSDTFTIIPGAPLAANCTIAASTTLGSTLVADGTAQYTVTITLKDKSGNLVPNQTPTFSSTSTTINTASDILVQPTSSTTGIYTGTIASTVAGTRTITINSPTGLSTVTNTATFIPGSAYKLAFTQQPTDSPAGATPGISDIKVAVEDRQSNVVTSDTSSVTITINSGVSGAVLSGTSVVGVTAGTGVATFSGLNIDKSSPTTPYTLKASVAGSGVVMATSATFKIIAGGPSKIAFTGGTPTLFSGVCSTTAYTVQLQDPGNNASNPTATTAVTLGGGGSGIFYSNSTCGTAITSLSFSTSTSTKTIYFKDTKAETLTLTATGSALTTGSTVLKVNPSKVALAAPASVLAGQCSGAITISTAAYDNSAGNVSADTIFSVSGMSATGNFYASTDTLCTGTALTYDGGGTINVTATAGTSSTTVRYKGPKAESLSLNITGPTGFTTTSSTQSFNVLASHLAFTGPNTVVAGACSTAFTVQLQDANGTAVTAPGVVNYTINGLAGKHGAFYYSSANCTSSTSPVGSTLTITSGYSSATLYFKDTTAEPLTLYISDPLITSLKIPNSSSITMNVSPSALGFLAGAPTTAATSACAGPFTVKTLDSSGTAVNAVTTINVNLSGQGGGGTFYPLNSLGNCTTCTGTLTLPLQFTTGVGSQSFCFSSLAPGALTFSATDNASPAVLSPTSTPFTVTAAPAWIGTKDVMSWFETGKNPLQTRFDSVQGAQVLHFSPSDSAKQYLYVVDTGANRILKYDYTNQSLIGWIGAFNSTASQLTGSGVPGNVAACTGLTTSAQTPGWCLGGQSTTGTSTWGGMYTPTGIADDGTHLFVANYNFHMVSRYNMATGAFEGWIGTIASNPSSAGTGLTNACAATASGPTPGWCKGGVSTYTNFAGDGTLRAPNAIGYASGYIFVGAYGQIKRYDATTGAFMGWIGNIATQPTGYPSDVSDHGCASAAVNSQTPGWCTGGTGSAAYAIKTGGVSTVVGSLMTDPINDILYSVDYNCINKYTISTGAFIETIALNTATTAGILRGNYQPQLSSDKSTIYIADDFWIAKLDAATGTVQGWIGTVSTSPVAGVAGCAGLATNLSTPGWCQGGTAKYGMDEKSVHEVTGLEIDASGNILTGQYRYFPGIKKWDGPTGAYLGTMSPVENGQNSWSTDAAAISSMRGFGDVGMAAPSGLYNDGTYLYIADRDAGRIKQVSLTTGAVVGWLGGLTSAPTSGVTGCVGATIMGPSPGWCLGANYNPSYMNSTLISSTADGILSSPTAMAGDLTYLYVLDGSRIVKFRISDGLYMGWIGGLASSPTGGTCTGTNGTASTSGWCKGGTAAAGSGNGYLNVPQAIYQSGGELYVTDYSNNRVTKHNANTGVFDGWIGRIGTGTPSGSGCTNVTKGGYTYASGWCKGGTAQAAISTGDPGGGFYNPLAITGDGNYLYIGSLYTARVDKFSMAGAYISSVRSQYNNYTDAWTTDPTSIVWNNFASSAASWTDGTYIYNIPYSPLPIVVKRRIGTGPNGEAAGTIVGWQGGISTTTPTSGDTGCSGPTNVATPGWCVGGTNTVGYKFGQFYTPVAITGDTNFIYIADSTNNRVIRLPK